MSSGIKETTGILKRVNVADINRWKANIKNTDETSSLIHQNIKNCMIVKFRIIDPKITMHEYHSHD